MDLNDYQERAGLTAISSGYEHMAFGLLEEAGEVAGVLKRIWRGDEGYTHISDYTSIPPVSDMARDKLKGELGDCLWYIAMLADVAGLSLEEVALHNLLKLKKRMKNDTIKGTGDDR